MNVIVKKISATKDENIRDLERKIEHLSESVAYFQGCMDTIIKEMYRINDHLLELKYIIKEK